MSWGKDEKGFLEKNFGKLIIVAVVLVILLVVGLSGLRTVESGTKGVHTVWGEVRGVRNEGLHWVNPFFGEDIVIMNTQIQKAEATESTGTLDLQSVTTSLAVNYKLREDSVLEIYKTLRRDYESRVIKPNIEESIKAATAKFTASELITKREEVKDAFLTIIENRLDDYGIDVLSVSMTDFQFSASFDAEIEAKVTAEQQALTEKNKLESIRYQAQQQVIQAEAEANATVARANAEAEAMLIVAKANADAIDLIQNKLTPEYLEYLATMEWDGRLPFFYGENGMPFVTIPLPTDGE